MIPASRIPLRATAIEPQPDTLLPDSRSSLIGRHPLIAFFTLAYLCSWIVEIPIALAAQGVIAIPIPRALHYLAAFGPGLAAIIVTRVCAGWIGVGHLLRGLTRWRVRWGYALFALGGPLGLFMLAIAVARIWEGAWPDLRLLGQIDDLPYLGIVPAFGVWVVTFGLGEEVGWRGFALPRLQALRSPWIASLILGLFWGLWHLPAFWYRDTYLRMGAGGVPLLLFSVITASVTFTWLYNGTQRSLLFVVVFHALFDFLSVSPAGGAQAAAVMSTGIILWTIGILVRARWRPLAAGAHETPARVFTNGDLR